MPVTTKVVRVAVPPNAVVTAFRQYKRPPVIQRAVELDGVFVGSFFGQSNF